MKRTLLFALCACLLLLSACAKRQPAAQSAELPKAAQDAAETAEAAEEALPVTRLTLGTVDFDTEKDRLRGLIQLYNSSGAPVSIEIINYADGAESRADAVTRMTTELMAGNVPDLLDCSDLSGAQYAGYAKSGVLAPLEELSSDDILSGVMEPCRVDGTLYSVVGAFILDPLFGPAARLGDSLQTSVEDVLSGAVPDVRFVWNGRDLLEVYCRHAAEQFLDYDTQTASFESEHFLRILTACAAVTPSELGPDSIMQQPMACVGDYSHMQNFWYEQTGSAFRVLALSEDGGTAYQPILQLGVCAGSAQQDAAREALRAMLGSSFQQQITTAFPVSRSVLCAQMQTEIEAQQAYQPTTAGEDGRIPTADAGSQAFLFDEAAAEDLMHVLEHVNCRSCGNQEILSIILDEADTFFSGQKTAQEAARVMDRRAALFLAEAG